MWVDVRSIRRELIAVVVAVLLVAAAFSAKYLDLGIVRPLVNATPQRLRDFADTAPIFGWWEAHVGWGTLPAIVIGVAAVLWGQAVARRLPWPAVPWVTWATACAWAFSLAMIDGWQRGFAGRLTARHEYLRQVPTITDIPETVRTFSSRILDFQPNSWITHVSGHPPGALLTFVWLDRIGLGGGAWAGLLCLLAGSSAAAAIVVAVFWLAGFWWFDGYHLVQDRYWQGIALDRPFQYWSWANLASTVCAVGLGTVAGLARTFDIAALKSRSGLHLVVLGALLAILCADLSMLSKAETERIWLPFTVWLVAAAALTPPRSHRWWLALNVGGALLINHFIFTNW